MIFALLSEISRWGILIGLIILFVWKEWYVSKRIHLRERCKAFRRRRAALADSLREYEILRKRYHDKDYADGAAGGKLREQMLKLGGQNNNEYAALKKIYDDLPMRKRGSAFN